MTRANAVMAFELSTDCRLDSVDWVSHPEGYGSSRKISLLYLFISSCLQRCMLTMQSLEQVRGGFALQCCSFETS